MEWFSQVLSGAMPMQYYLRWLAFLIIFLLMVFWHLQRNHAIFRHIASQKNVPNYVISLRDTAFSRTKQVFALFLAILVGMAVYDMRGAAVQATLKETQTALEETQGALTLAEDELNKPTLPSQLSTTVSEASEQAQDQLKQKYEELFVNYYYMKRCEFATKTDFHLLNAGLLHDMTVMNAPAGLRQSILTAARGTHDELYKDAPCTQEAILPMQQKINDYIAASVENLPDF